MRSYKSIAYVLSAASAIVVLLGGCNAGDYQSPVLKPGSTDRRPVAPPRLTEEQLAQMIALTNRADLLPTIRRDRHRSWIVSDARKKWLLYATDGDSGTVDIYNYKSKPGKLVGQITGFDFPYGPCTDSAGNVYITDVYAGAIYEYRHGDTTLKKTLNVSGYPSGCSVDPKTGNLAVSGSGITSTQACCVWVFPNASGTPAVYSDPNIDDYWSPGYDNGGNLFVEGTTNWTTNYLDELPSGGSGLIELSLVGGTIGTPGGVMWDGSHLAVAVQGYNNLPLRQYFVFQFRAPPLRLSELQYCETIATRAETTPTSFSHLLWAPGK